MDSNDQSLQEVLRLERENNKMLHSMRRNAFLGGIFKLLIWTGLIVVPIWLYSQYLAPIVEDLQRTIQQVQGTGAQAQVQLNGFQDMLKEWSSKAQAVLPSSQ